MEGSNDPYRASPSASPPEKSEDVSNSAHSYAPERPEDEPQYPGKAKLILIILSLNLAMFLVGLDNTIISSAIPRITDQFNALDDVGWYASAYMLTNCAFQLAWGKLYTFYDVKWVYLAALFIFELGSLICAVSPSSKALIVGRAIAGLGGGGVGNGSFLFIAHSVPQQQRPTYIGMMGAMYGFSAIARPLMGGAFTDNPTLTWRWCFYINLPLGAVPALVLLFFVSPFRGSKDGGEVGFIQQLKQMDLFGTLCLLPGVICLLLALQWGGATYPWSNGRIIALFVIAGCLLVGFCVVEYISGDHAVVPRCIFGNRNVWGSSLFGSCVVACFFTMLYYVPISFQAIKDASPIRSGVMALPMVLSYVAFSFMGGALTSVIGYYMPFAYGTIILMAIGTGLLSTLEVNSGRAAWIGYQFLLGGGVGFGLQTAFAASQCVLPIEDISVGTAIVLFTENLASAVMVSVAEKVFTNQLVSNVARYVPDADTGAILRGGATSIKEMVPSSLYAAVLFAYNKSLTQTFHVGVALSCCGILGTFAMQWESVKKDAKKATSSA